MEGTSNIEREYGALGGLFQQIIQDMKVGDITINTKGNKVWASYAIIVLLSNGKVAVDILYNAAWFWLAGVQTLDLFYWQPLR